MEATSVSPLKLERLYKSKQIQVYYNYVKQRAEAIFYSLLSKAATLIFMAPEMLMGDRMYGPAVDIWAVGCILLEMAGKNNPFGAKDGNSSVNSVINEIFRKIGKPRKGSRLFSLPHCPKDEQGYPEVCDIVPSLLDEDGKDLLKKLLAVDPIDRITAEQALNHGYLKLKRDESIAAKSMGRHISALHLGQPLRLGHNGMTGPSSDLRFGSSSTSQTLPLQRKSLMVDISHNALDELIVLLQNNSLWISSADGREVLDLEVYKSIFPRVAKSPNVRIESSRDSGVVIMNSCLGLVDMFMDANKWMKFFPDIVLRATTVDVISTGSMGSPNGLLKLMYEESQVLSPLVPTREFFFLRFCQQIDPNSWAIVDVSYDSPHDRHSNSQCRARRLPSGCFIEDMHNDHLKITWMEHVEIEDTRPIHNLYKEYICSGLAFGAARRLATLQRTCERLNFQMKICKSLFDIGGIHMSCNGKKSLMKLSQNMVNSFCSSINQMNGKKVMNSEMNDCEICAIFTEGTDPGHPNSMVLSAATSIWLPFSPQKVFDLLRDERSRPQWDVLSNPDPVQEVGHIVSGYYPGNCISVLGAFNTSQNSMLILQESCIDSSGALVVYCPIDLPAIKTAMRSEDPSFIPILSSGFAILPDAEDKSGARERSGGSLVTVVLQRIASNSTSGKLRQELIKTVANLVGKFREQIKAALNCSTC